MIFKINNKFQKSKITYRDIITRKIVDDISRKIIGVTGVPIEFYNEVNVGRLGVLETSNDKFFICFSQNGKIEARNSFFQSVTTALSAYINDGTSKNKKLYFYFLDYEGQSIETEYFIFMYRLMKTAGFTFLNEKEYLTREIKPFIFIDDMIKARNTLSKSNKSNNPSFMTINKDLETEIFAKTYGASKKESVLLILAATKLSDNITVYEVEEQKLPQLPKPDKEAIENTNRVIFRETDIVLNKSEFLKDPSLRSPRYVYNLLKELGDKKCTLCSCDIPEIIDGAHLWPIAEIKGENRLSTEQKLEYATSGFNGLWMCQNHHKLFDIDFLVLTEDGEIMLPTILDNNQKDYIYNITTTQNIEIKEDSAYYLRKRNKKINMDEYNKI